MVAFAGGNTRMDLAGGNTRMDLAGGNTRMDLAGGNTHAWQANLKLASTPVLDRLSTSSACNRP